MVSAPTTVPFLLLNTFSTDCDTSNPAAVVLLLSPSTSYAVEELLEIAKNLHQPITTLFLFMLKIIVLLLLGHGPMVEDKLYGNVSILCISTYVGQNQ